MAVLPRVERTPLERAMIFLNEDEHVTDKRAYLGMSVIGSKCHRYLQFCHYGCIKPVITERVERIFDDGRRAEDQLTKALLIIGITVSEQQKEVIGITGHVKGHIDGIGEFLNDKCRFCLADRFLVEFKTHKDDKFKLVKKEGVKKAFRLYYEQVMAYMHHLKLTDCLYMGKNKNTSEVYLEHIKYDAGEYDDIQRKVIEVISADTLLPRIGTDNPTWFECKLCDGHEVCFGYELPHQDCRNCTHGEAINDGKWYCNFHDETLEHLEPCDHYKMSEFFNV